MREIFLENSSNNIFSLGNPKLHNKIIKSQIDSIITTTTTTKEKHNFLSSSVLNNIMTWIWIQDVVVHPHNRHLD